MALFAHPHSPIAITTRAFSHQLYPNLTRGRKRPSLDRVARWRSSLLLANCNRGRKVLHTAVWWWYTSPSRCHFFIQEASSKAGDIWLLGFVSGPWLDPTSRGEILSEDKGKYSGPSAMWPIYVEPFPVLWDCQTLVLAGSHFSIHMPLIRDHPSYVSTSAWEIRVGHIMQRRTIVVHVCTGKGGGDLDRPSRPQSLGSGWRISPLSPDHKETKNNYINWPLITIKKPEVQYLSLNSLHTGRGCCYIHVPCTWTPTMHARSYSQHCFLTETQTYTAREVCVLSHKCTMSYKCTLPHKCVGY